MSYLIDTDYDVMTGTHRMIWKRVDRRRNVVEILVPQWKEVAEGEHFDEKLLWRIDRQELDSLLRAMADEAWRLGVKPTAYPSSGDQAQMKAMDLHLADMRRLVFDQFALLTKASNDHPA